MNESKVQAHGGNIDALSKELDCGREEILDFSANLNPLGFPEWLRPLVNSQISNLAYYPDIRYEAVKKSLETRWGIPASELVLGNGASELLYFLPRIIRYDLAILPVPSYGDYERVLQKNSIPYEYFELRKEINFDLEYDRLERILKRDSDKKKLIILGHPNNPTGRVLNHIEIENLAKRYKNTFWIMDESFLDFCPNPASLRKNRPDNMAIVWSLTKILSIPGLRAGVCIADSDICEKLSDLLPPWSVNRLAAAVIEKATEDPEFFELSRKSIQLWKKPFFEQLNSIPQLTAFPSETNFILVELSSTEITVSGLKKELLEKYKLSIRDCENIPGLGTGFFRIAVRNAEDNRSLISALREIFKIPSGSITLSRKKPALMMQGTASNVGKSLLTAAFCRIFRQDGIRVAPFKSQNMALNSFVTADGFEIGRAQALQAQAAGIPADVRMNPILLKPSSEKDSQVILNGKPIEAMDFRDYTKFKPKAFEQVMKSYDSLSEEYEVIVLEGAGSVSEVNLKANDIVNMRMAQYAEAKVLLVGNIDHGGIFGALVGSLETMAEWERKLVSGFLINRFRGIPELLNPGIQYLKTYTNKSVLGVIPHFEGLGLPEEDSLEFKSGKLSDESPLRNRIDIAMIDTPRISNHTDVDALRLEEDVRLRIVRSAAELGNPDVLILPGSKNVASDMHYLRTSGFSEKILKMARDDAAEIVGICGGYQILGAKIYDPHKIESATGTTLCLSLLPIETTLEKEKILKQVAARHLPSDKVVYGYEIHHGHTELKDSIPTVVVSKDGVPLGHSNQNGRIWGTYIHGIFDADEFRRSFLDKIRVRKGMNALGGVTAKYELESSLERLAIGVRNSVNMNEIYGLIGLK
ncbi:cobyric acid synthase CobQ [Leptospira inadai serovar Lyme str. 10]|uniref:Cobyric acid synthase n=2 Tax=Leptospira inadai serovar Lyme TaxID=293084 RepID=V6HH31_9LEPT|nr:cobyric acid synthase [Leptospira inadai]EQA35340.1 cobyric acid synthase CobQ [Leptospira inadai serovar Lyme str. 10]PNV71927.1 cobyric acid synthase [Leptospira inadai serovar Lyme]